MQIQNVANVKYSVFFSSLYKMTILLPAKSNACATRCTVFFILYGQKNCTLQYSIKWTLTSLKVHVFKDRFLVYIHLTYIKQYIVMYMFSHCYMYIACNMLHVYSIFSLFFLYMYTCIYYK